MTRHPSRLHLMLVAVFVLAGLLASGAAGAPAPDSVRVYMQDGHALGKYEPAQGTYLGAFVLSDPNVDRSMATFESKIGKKHAAYIYYLHYKERPIADTQWWLDTVAAQNAGATVSSRGSDSIP